MKIQGNILTLNIDEIDAEMINKLVRYFSVDRSKTSDGWHTFEELYSFRKMYNALLFNEWAKPITCHTPTEDVILERPKYNVHKSKKHYDGELCFGGGWFIVVAMLPTGMISNHYKEEDWHLFQIPETEKALFEYDNHTPQDVLERLKNL